MQLIEDILDLRESLVSFGLTADADRCDRALAGDLDDLAWVVARLRENFASDRSALDWIDSDWSDLDWIEAREDRAHALA